MNLIRGSRQDNFAKRNIMKKLIRLIMLSAAIIVSLHNVVSCQVKEVYEIEGMCIDGVTEGIPIQVREGEYAEFDVHYTTFSVSGPSYNMSNPTFVWSSSDENIVRINRETGEYYAVAPGTCIITVTNVQTNVYLTCTVEVLPLYVEKVSLDCESCTLKEGETLQLCATLTPDNALYSEIEWSTSEEQVATVNKNGYVVAKNEGTCIIKARVKRRVSGYTYAECQITVLANSAQYIIISQEQATLFVGEQLTLSASVLPDYLPTSEKTIRWISSDPSVASVSSVGKVVAVKEGYCDILAIANNDLSAVCELQVKAIEVTGVTLSKAECVLDPGEELFLTCTITPSDATYKDVVWTSSLPNIASVDDEGKIIAHNSGQTMIKATAKNGVYGTCLVTVRVIDVESVTLDITEKTLVVGESCALNATVAPANANVKEITWTSSDPNIASVDSNGNVLAIKEGECKIIATANNGKKAECAINVRIIAVEQVTLNVTSQTLEEQESFTLTATVTPHNATYKDVVWSSSDASVASVDETGKVTAIKEGSCVISANCTNDKVATCQVTVTPILVRSVTISSSSYRMMVGETKSINYTVNPVNAKITDVSWRIEDTSIATVSTDGVVTSKAIGTTKLTVTINGQYTAECQIRVCDISDFISLQFGGMAISSVNGYVTGQVGCYFINDSSQGVVVKSIQLIDSASGSAGNLMSVNETVSAHSSVGYNITINRQMYKPIFRWTYTYEGKDYTVDIKLDK